MRYSSRLPRCSTLPLILLAFFFQSASLGGESNRKWTSRNGKHTTVARYLGTYGDRVALARGDRHIWIKPTQLSKSDRQYLEERGFQTSAVSFANKSGMSVVVRLMGPMAAELRIHDGKSEMAAAKVGEYVFTVRYGDKEPYDYGRSESFSVNAAAASLSEINLLEMLGGNVNIRPISANDFEKKYVVDKLTETLPDDPNTSSQKTNVGQSERPAKAAGLQRVRRESNATDNSNVVHLELTEAGDEYCTLRMATNLFGRGGGVGPIVGFTARPASNSLLNATLTNLTSRTLRITILPGTYLRCEATKPDAVITEGQTIDLGSKETKTLSLATASAYGKLDRNDEYRIPWPTRPEADSVKVCSLPGFRQGDSRFRQLVVWLELRDDLSVHTKYMQEVGFGPPPTKSELNRVAELFLEAGILHKYRTFDHKLFQLVATNEFVANAIKNGTLDADGIKVCSLPEFSKLDAGVRQLVVWTAIRQALGAQKHQMPEFGFGHPTKSELIEAGRLFDKAGVLKKYSTLARVLPDVIWTIDIREAIAQDMLKVEFSGAGITSVLWATLKSNRDNLLAVRIPAGLVFSSASTSVQNMMAITDIGFQLERGEERSVSIPVACINMNRDIPRKSDVFTISTEVSGDLRLLVECEEFQWADEPLRRNAVWTVTDNPTRTGYKVLANMYTIAAAVFSSGMSDQQLDEIKNLLRKAGIRTSKYRVFQ